jgi:hypothetical protein
MPNYNNGRIYKIVCNTTGKVYIGSTTRNLCKRLATHVSGLKRWVNNNSNAYVSSYDVLSNSNYSIVLLENFPCSTSEELHARERYYVDTIDCVNKNKPIITKDELRKDVAERCKELYRKNVIKNPEIRKMLNERSKMTYYRKKEQEKLDGIVKNKRGRPKRQVTKVEVKQQKPRGRPRSILPSESHRCVSIQKAEHFDNTHLPLEKEDERIDINNDAYSSENKLKEPTTAN